MQTLPTYNVSINMMRSRHGHVLSLCTVKWMLLNRTVQGYYFISWGYLGLVNNARMVPTLIFWRDINLNASLVCNLVSSFSWNVRVLAGNSKHICFAGTWVLQTRMQSLPIRAWSIHALDIVAWLWNSAVQDNIGKRGVNCTSRALSNSQHKMFAFTIATGSWWQC